MPEVCQAHHRRDVITEDALRAFERSFELTGGRITNTGSSLVLEGQAPSYQAKTRAGIAAAVLAGGLPVFNRLRVVYQSHRCDAVLGAAVMAALNAAPQVAAGRSISVVVRAGVVFLEGDAHSIGASHEAEIATWNVAGVADVRNNLRVRLSAS